MSTSSHPAMASGQPVEKKKTKFGVFPCIVWEVADIIDMKLSPVVSFMGMKWKLKLQYFHGGSSERKIEISLIRLSVPRRLLNMNLIVQTALQHDIGYTFLSKTVTTKTSHKGESTIWMSSCSEIYRVLAGTPNLSLTFLVRIHSLQINEIPPGADDHDDATWTVSLSEGTSKVVLSDEYSDVVLKCGEKCFSAHRAILSARSHVFAAMFRGDTTEVREKQLEIVNIEPDVFEQLLRFMYCGTIADLTIDSVRKIYLAANTYGLETLKIQCTFFMMENMRNDGSVPEADEKVSKDGLLQELFQSREWVALAKKIPKLAHDMCKPIMLNVEQ